MIEQTVRMVHYSHRARHARIESVPHSDLPKVRVMPQQFQQVLMNLLLNALDAVEGLEGDQVITVERAVADGWVTVVVKDGGRGMEPDQIRQAFEPFYTTKAPGRGTGLGLAISYRLTEVQGGRIWIDSTPGQGTAVSVSFKAVRAVRVLVDRLERHLADLDDPAYIEALNFDLDEVRRRWGMS